MAKQQKQAEQSREPGREAQGPARTHEPQMKSEPKPPFPAQHQPWPGKESDIRPRPQYKAPRYKPAAKLDGKCALVTGGDSGIGRAVAVIYAREGADVAITHLPQERSDADETRRAIEAEGRRCILIEADLSEREACEEAIERTVRELGALDILVHNAARQSSEMSLDDLSDEEWDFTFRTNIYAYFRLAKAALQHMKPGSAIIATSSETAYLGPERLPDYAATKGAINTFTRVLAKQLADRGIRVNAVAPGPVWTPLNIADPGTKPEQPAKQGDETPMKRPGQPEEIAPAYVFLASDPDSSYITGEIIAITGGAPLG